MRVALLILLYMLEAAARVVTAVVLEQAGAVEVVRVD